MSDEHKAPQPKALFCAVRADSPCGDCEWKAQGNYRKICEPSGWSTFSFKQGLSVDGVRHVFDKSYEAHHVLCVSSVGTALGDNPDLQPTAEQTRWCINGEPNMIALPLWGHTVKYYCDLSWFDEISEVGDAIDVGEFDFLKSVVPPAFADLPQHDWDHNCSGGYTDEVTARLKEELRYVKKEGHEFKPEDLRATLDGLSKKFAGELRERGKRNLGTHKAWSAGQKDPASNWYLDFSMARKSVAQGRPFARRSWNRRVAQRLRSLVKNLMGA